MQCRRFLAHPSYQTGDMCSRYVLQVFNRNLVSAALLQGACTWQVLLRQTSTTACNHHTDIVCIKHAAAGWLLASLPAVQAAAPRQGCSPSMVTAACTLADHGHPAGRKPRLQATENKIGCPIGKQPKHVCLIINHFKWIPG